MNDLKRNRNSLVYVVLLAFIAGGIGIYLSGDVPRKVAEVNSGGGFKAFAVGPMAAFLVKADRPQVPDLAFKDSAGSEIKLSKWQGRVVLLNLWATWCDPCLDPMPSLEQLQINIPDKLVVIALSVDQGGKKVVVPFLNRLGLKKVKIYLDPKSDVGHAFEVRGLPTSIVIGADGKVLGKVEGAADWDSIEMRDALTPLLPKAPAKDPLKRALNR